MYEDVEAAAAQTGGTLALTGLAFDVQWLILAGLLAVIAGVAALRVARR